MTLGERLYDLEARIEGVFPLVIGDPEGPPDWFEDFCEGCDGPSKSVFQMFAALEGFIEGDEYPEEEVVADVIVNNPSINGWVCRIAWCPRRYQGDKSGIYTSGWGVTRWRYVWGQTADDAVELALVYVSDSHEKSRATAVA